MTENPKELLLKERDWLREEWAKRGQALSGSMIAKAAQLLAKRAGDPVVIRQQQIDAIRNATEDKGPAKVPLWWRHVRTAFETGAIDELIGVKLAPMPDPPTDTEYSITDSTGRVIGRITLFDKM